MMNRFWLMLVVCLLGITAGCGDGGDASAPQLANAPISQDKRLTIAVIPKATTHEYWKSIHAGAVKAAKELDVDVIWKGPLSESDRESQINVVQDFVTKKVDGICLAPLDSQALIQAVHEAKVAGIPTVLYDSGLESLDESICFVATDNRNGGAIAAKELGRLLSGKGSVLVLRYSPGSQSSTDRENGFIDTLKAEFPQITIVSESEYAGATAESALDKAQQLLGKFGDKIDGVFTPCEHVSLGFVKALEERALLGKVKLVGFDASPKLVQHLRDGQIHGLVLQDPVGMGEIAVKAMVAHLRGQTVKPRISTGELLANKANMDQPQVQQRLNPEQVSD